MKYGTNGPDLLEWGDAFAAFVGRKESGEGSAALQNQTKMATLPRLSGVASQVTTPLRGEPHE
jgi:hypothetical protein